MRSVECALFASLLALWPAVATAQAIDCDKHVQKAQSAIDKVNEDMKGMESMPKDELVQIHALLDDATKMLQGARQTCQHPKADYDRAQAIARAEAARGSAEAADILHWHYMKSMPAMKSGSSMPGMPGMKK
jgi:hypothetical protein